MEGRFASWPVYRKDDPEIGTPEAGEGMFDSGGDDSRPVSVAGIVPWEGKDIDAGGLWSSRGAALYY